jgi:hypothetical protein
VAFGTTRQLQLTLFVSPDWRRISAVADRFWRHLPWLESRLYLARGLPKGTIDLRNHPEFVAFLNAAHRDRRPLVAPRQSGHSISVEFRNKDRAACAAELSEAMTSDPAGAAPAAQAAPRFLKEWKPKWVPDNTSHLNCGARTQLF